jgi:hypothetical protein
MKAALISAALLICMILTEHTALAQQSPFTGDAGTYSSELTMFMGPNLKEGETEQLLRFSAAWDSTLLANSTRQKIITASGLMIAKRMRPQPHFSSLINTLMIMLDYDTGSQQMDEWLDGFINLAATPAVQVSILSRFIETGGLVVSERILYKSPSVTWKVPDHRFRFVNDSLFRIEIPGSDLICYAQGDSAMIKATSGSYIPAGQTWHGVGGRITWERSGYPENEVWATPGEYSFPLTSASWEIDSVIFHHPVYFDEPVTGRLSDRAIKVTDQDNVVFPKFETYQKTFFLEDIYKDVDFSGGLAFEGSTVRGTGSTWEPSRITVYRNDTLYVRVQALDFIFDRTSVKSQSTAFTLYLEDDSIYHSDVAFSYNVPTREVNTYRSRFPTSRSPYFSSYHKMDMYFEYLTWKLDEPMVKMSRARGASMGQAYFESASFFNQNEFHRLMALDEFHPLYRLSQFAEWDYNNTFPVDEFAAWMKQSPEYATSLCIDLANSGFLYYDRANDEITIKQKLYDYINSYARRQDYDVISMISETESPVDNAELDMKDFTLTINGIPRIFLSDSQNVVIYPYNRTISMDKNRSFDFDGVVQAGMITIFGHNFRFNYDTFKINLVNVDSIMLAVETDQRDEFGSLLARRVEDLIQMTNADLLIDDPSNKSGLRSLEQYPIFTSTTESYIFYDRIPGLEKVYPRDEYFFKLEPFTFENTDKLTEDHLLLKGEFTAGRIMPPMEHTLSLQNDKSLGFLYNLPDEGQPVYEGQAVLFNQITMSNQGLMASGRMNHLSATIVSQEFSLFPDSLITMAESFQIAGNTIYPETESGATSVKWYPWEDRMEASLQDRGDSFAMFGNGTSLKGSLILGSDKLSGTGEIDLPDSRIASDLFSFGPQTIQADSSAYNLKSISGDGYAFIAEDAGTTIDFANQTSRFSLNSDSSLVKFPEIDYISTMTDFEYNMEERILSMTQRGRESTTLMTPDELIRQDFKSLEKPAFFSTNRQSDTITFSASKGRYLVEGEKIIAEDVNYIHIADALIQPDEGIVGLNRGGRFDPMTSSVIAINNNHIIHNAAVNIINSKRYSASGIYDYKDENGEIWPIAFNDITVDSLRTKASGNIKESERFMLGPAFSFTGDVHLASEAEHLRFLGAAGIVNVCDGINSTSVRFNSEIDPLNIMIPVSDKPRNETGSMVNNGSYLTVDSTHIYPAFLTPEKSWSDIPLVSSEGYLIYDNSSGTYRIASLEKLADLSRPGDMISLMTSTCVLESEGKLNTGMDFGLLKISSAGEVTHNSDSGTVSLNAMLALDFHFSSPALAIMADEIRFIPTLDQVNVTSEDYRKMLLNLTGSDNLAADRDNIDLFGAAAAFPPGFKPELLLNDVTLIWNEYYQSYRSKGRIGIGSVGGQAVNLYVDGFIELQKRRSGDMLDIYLKADNATWYWISYTRGVLMTLSGNNQFNAIISEEKQNNRKHPDNSVRTPYIYMIGVQDRFNDFLRRMRSDEEEPYREEEFTPVNLP